MRLCFSVPALVFLSILAVDAVAQEASDTPADPLSEQPSSSPAVEEEPAPQDEAEPAPQDEAEPSSQGGAPSQDEHEQDEHAQDHGDEHAQDHGDENAQDHGDENAQDDGDDHAQDHGDEHAQDHGDDHVHGDGEEDHDQEDEGGGHHGDHGDGPVFSLRYRDVEIVPDFKLYADYQIDVASDELDNGFHITRGYLGLRLRIFDWLEGRVTYDISQVSDIGASGAAPVEDGEATVDGSRVNGSMVARLKYAYINLGIPRINMRIRFGVIHTPWMDWIEHIEDTRFLRKVMFENEYHYPSADFGAALTGTIGQYVAYHVGAYNGEGYHGVEDTRFKDIMGRLTLRPVPGIGALAGLALSGYFQVEIPTDDEDGTRRIFGGALTYRLAEEVTSVDTTHSHGDILAAWVQAFAGQEGESDHMARSVGLSVGLRVELPPNLFLITRLDWFDHNLDEHDDSVWTALGAFGIRIWRGLLVAVDYQGRIPDSGDATHMVGLHTELRL